MIIILALLLIGIVISYSFWRWSCRSDGIGFGIVCTIVIIIVLVMGWTKSYTTYLDARSFYSATKEQYHSAIEVYANYAVIDISKAAFTDLKYQGYQQNVGRFITDLRNKIIRYNTTIVKKRIMANNLLFNWFIVEPDADMIILKMKME